MLVEACHLKDRLSKQWNGQTFASTHNFITLPTLMGQETTLCTNEAGSSKLGSFNVTVAHVTNLHSENFS